MAKVLIADDSKFMRKILSDILVKEGHQITAEAENGKEAIVFYRKLKPEVVTLDIVMPEVEGVNAISALEEIQREDPDAKVVIISATGQEEIVKEFVQAGAKSFITKPFQPSKVTGVIEAVLSGK
jgi:two-component system chemotaxis response regulator CheY